MLARGRVVLTRLLIAMLNVPNFLMSAVRTASRGVPTVAKHVIVTIQILCVLISIERQNLT